MTNVDRLENIEAIATGASLIAHRERRKSAGVEFAPRRMEPRGRSRTRGEGETSLPHNGCNQQLATLREPYRPTLSRVRCIALLSLVAFLRLRQQNDNSYSGKRNYT